MRSGRRGGGPELPSRGDVDFYDDQMQVPLVEVGIDEQLSPDHAINNFPRLFAVEPYRLSLE
jgi:hypothetical protein